MHLVGFIISMLLYFSDNMHSYKTLNNKTSCELDKTQRMLINVIFLVLHVAENI